MGLLLPDKHQGSINTGSVSLLYSGEFTRIMLAYSASDGLLGLCWFTLHEMVNLDDVGLL